MAANLSKSSSITSLATIPSLFAEIGSDSESFDFEKPFKKDDNQKKIYKKTFENQFLNKSRNIGKLLELRAPKPRLTIEYCQEEIVKSIKNNQVTIIKGPTGCGKTTKVPLFIIDMCKRERKCCNIMVTQPRRIAAISIAKRVCDENYWKLGSIVGYKVGLASCTTDETNLTYCTTGVLLQRLIMQKTMNDLSHIILDEVHERDQDMDFLLLVIKRLLQNNKNPPKIILMSATFDINRFSKYFSSKDNIPAPIINIDRINFYHTDCFYLDDLTFDNTIDDIIIDEPKLTNDMMKLGITILKRLDLDLVNNIEQVKRPAVLIFLPGIWDIERFYNLLTIDTNDKYKWNIMVLHSSITNDEQQKIFDPPTKGYRRIILSTNVAESSITVPDIKYVIDFCLTKQLTTDPITNYQCLELTWASRVNCEQRAGRTGRTANGIVYRMINKSKYHKLMDENPPEILRSPLEIVVLKAKILNLDTPKKLLSMALDPPNLTNLKNTILLLKETGGLVHDDTNDDNEYDGELTDLGRIMAHLPVDIHITKMILLGQLLSVFNECIIIGASMSVRNMFVNPFKRKLDAYKVKKHWSQNSLSDGITCLNAYNSWIKNSNDIRNKTSEAAKAWASRNYLQLKVLNETKILIDEINQRLNQMGIKESMGHDKVIWENTSERHLIIKIVMAGAFYPNYYIGRQKMNEFMAMKELNGLDPLKTVCLYGWPHNQPGILYAKHIQNYFQPCLSNDIGNITVKFNSSTRVYVHFEKITDKQSGEIPLAIYNALKLRTIGDPLSIPILTSEEAYEKMKKLKLKDSIPILYYKNDNTIEDIDDNDDKINFQLPKLDENHFKIIMTRIVSPSNFWIKIDNEKNKNYQLKIKNYLSSLDPNELESFKEIPSIGTIVLAPYHGSNPFEYERAIIEGISMETKTKILAHIAYIDSGYDKLIQVDHLRCMTNEYLNDDELNKIPRLAIQCRLANVKPIQCSSTSDDWSTDAKQAFETFGNNSKLLTAEVYSVVNDIVSITLSCNTLRKVINLNEYLINKKYAEYCEENYSSKNNYQNRIRVKELSLEDKLYFEKMQYNQNKMIESYVDPPAESECLSLIDLRGPESPLEMIISNLSTTGTGRKILIGDDSVNSVLLKSNLSNENQHKLIVAANVNESNLSKNLTLRNTNVLPNIPGLTSILTLLFTPQIDLRCNEDKTILTGALCGLGYNKLKMNESLFPEHDILIHFDHEFTADDLLTINKLRYLISSGINIRNEYENNTDNDCSSVDTNRYNETIIRNQIKIQKNLLKLIQKQRNYVDPNVNIDLTINQNQWRVYDEEMYVKTKFNDDNTSNIFKLHRTLNLDDPDFYDSNNKLIDHLETLKRLASLNFSEDVDKIDCLLCNETIYGIMNLRSHITSIKHRIPAEKLLQ